MQAYGLLSYVAFFGRLLLSNKHLDQKGGTSGNVCETIEPSETRQQTHKMWPPLWLFLVVFS